MAEAEKRIGDRRNQEFHSTVADLRILASLAQYHAQRIPAAVSYRLFERTQDPDRLDDAISGERNAIEAWRQLVAAAGDVYTDDLMMGVRGASLCGHWKDELAALERGWSALEQRRSELQPAAQTKAAPRDAALAGDGDVQAPDVLHQRVGTAPVGQPLTISVQVRDPSGVKCRINNDLDDPFINLDEADNTPGNLPAADGVLFDMTEVLVTCAVIGHDLHPTEAMYITYTAKTEEYEGGLAEGMIHELLGLDDLAAALETLYKSNPFFGAVFIYNDEAVHRHSGYSQEPTAITITVEPPMSAHDRLEYLDKNQDKALSWLRAYGYNDADIARIIGISIA